ncbi:MAG: ferritin-like domain-containing protein [Actinobacteria bacterium]|nr:ferritin-like domain-containing protein [Actinomycetota bacterium]
MHDSIERNTSEVEGVKTGATRRSFLKQAGIGGAAVLGGGALLGAVAGPARAGHMDDVPDVDILNFALTLEYLEAAFYVQALGGAGTTGVPGSSGAFGRGDITGSSVFGGFGGRIRSEGYGLLSDIRDHEVTHVDFLVGALGANAVGACTFDFSDALGSVDAFIGTAQVLENTGVMAYDGAIRYVDTGDFLQAGAQIATVEARHAAYLNLINRESPFPDAFDDGKLPSEIIAAVVGTGFIVTCPSEVTALFGRLP